MIRRVPGDVVEVSADVFADGTQAVRAVLRWSPPEGKTWMEAAMEPIGNDRWRGEFTVSKPGTYRYTVAGWVDPYLTWRAALERRWEAGVAEPLDLAEGAELLHTIGRRIGGEGGKRLQAQANAVKEALPASMERAIQIALDPSMDPLLRSPRGHGSVAEAPMTLGVAVDPLAAQHSAFYELFPRSTSPEEGVHGTLRDLRARLPYIAELGFDVVYLPPIHPIGRTHRRGPNNTRAPPAGAPGSPWAIGGAEGGHMSVHPELGDLGEFRQTVKAAHDRGLEIALDLAFQCSPDHPWVREHPQWFAHRPDGTIRSAENPPKKYDDIYPLDFDTPDWHALWKALREVVDFWVAQGVRWFRVDNPHTKPFEFWQWLIGEVRREHPEVMFLAEAFTRPRVMYRLAKVGFTHSYTYFAWRTNKSELVGYFRELTDPPVGEYFRPHLWPNTPDILTPQFQGGHRSIFLHRLVLAATLSSHYGIYGPAYELREHVPLEPGKEEYRGSEKYEVRHWRLDQAGTLAPEMRRLNRIRRDHPALTAGRHLTFHSVDNDRLLAYSRRTEDRSDVVLVVVNLDPQWTQSGWTSLDLGELGVPAEEPFYVHDLWMEARYRWHGEHNFIRLDPSVSPVHIFEIERGRPRIPPPVGRE